MWLTLVLLSALEATAPAVRVDLKGTVRNEAGAPIKGATVLIFTARPRQGVSLVCPSCYLDCWRRATTDAKGRFLFEKVDGSLVFEVGAVTPVHQTEFAEKVDPTLGEAELTLRARPPVPDAPRRVVRGRLVDRGGKAVTHAVVSPTGYRVGTTSAFGALEGLPELTLSDDQGTFTLAAGKDVDALILEVSARGLATTVFGRVPTGLAEQRLSLGSGCAVRGRVVKDGRPVAGITIGIAQTDRSSDSFAGERTAFTNAEGRFVLANIPPLDSTVLYSKMLDCGPYGALPLTDVKTGDHDSVVDLGELVVKPASRLRGRVVVPGGGPVPANSTLSLFRETAWDYLVVPISEDGTFVAQGLPREPLTMSVGVPGYRLSSENAGLIRRGPRPTLSIAPLEADREISVLLEPAPRPPSR